MTDAPARTVGIGEARRITGLTVRQIHHWTAQGWVPVHSRTGIGRSGGGPRLRFTRHRIAQLAVAAHLTHAGMAPPLACHAGAAAAAILAANPTDPDLLMIIGAELYTCQPADLPACIAAAGRLITVIDPATATSAALDAFDKATA